MGGGGRPCLLPLGEEDGEKEERGAAHHGRGADVARININHT